MNHDELSHLDAAYVLGALGPADRREFEEHLRGCAACEGSVREIAGLPGLLSQVDQTMVEPPEHLVVPDTLLPDLLRRVRDERRRRLRRVLAGTVVAASLVAAAGVGVWQALEPTRPATEPPTQAEPRVPANRMVPVRDTPLRADVALEQVPWGTKLELTCTYVTGVDDYAASTPPSFALVVHTRDGRSEQVATWRAVAGSTSVVAAATAAEQADIISLDVRTLSGQPVLELVR